MTSGKRETGHRLLARRVANVMQREMLCSEHGALCFLEANRRSRAKAKKEKRNGK